MHAPLFCVVTSICANLLYNANYTHSQDQLDRQVTEARAKLDAEMAVEPKPKAPSSLEPANEASSAATVDAVSLQRPAAASDSQLLTTTPLEAPPASLSEAAAPSEPAVGLSPSSAPTPAKKEAPAAPPLPPLSASLREALDANEQVLPGLQDAKERALDMLSKHQRACAKAESKWVRV